MKKASIFEGNASTRQLAEGFATVFDNRLSNERIAEYGFSSRSDAAAALLIDTVHSTRTKPYSAEELQEDLDHDRVSAACLCYRPVQNPDDVILGGEFLPRILSKHGLAVSDDYGDYATQGNKWAEIARRTILDGMAFLGTHKSNYSACFNMSERMIREKCFPHSMNQLTKRYGVEPSRVMLEVLEFVDPSTIAECSDTLGTLSDAGFSLGIDDMPDAYSKDIADAMSANGISPDFFKCSGATTTSVLNGGTALRELIDFGDTHGVTKFGLEGDRQHLITERVLERLQKLQDGFGNDVQLIIEGPVFPE